MKGCYLRASGRLRGADKPTTISRFTRAELLDIAGRAGLAGEVVDKGSGAFYRNRCSLVLKAGSAPARSWSREPGAMGGSRRELPQHTQRLGAERAASAGMPRSK